MGTVRNNYTGEAYEVDDSLDPVTAIAHAATMDAYRRTGRLNRLDVNAMAGLLSSDIPPQSAWQQGLQDNDNVAGAVQQIPEAPPRPATITGGQAVGLGLKGTELVLNNLAQQNQTAQEAYQERQRMVRQAQHDKMQQQANEEERADRLKHLKLQTLNDIEQRDIELQKLEHEREYQARHLTLLENQAKQPKVEWDKETGAMVKIFPPDEQNPQGRQEIVRDPTLIQAYKERLAADEAKQLAVVNASSGAAAANIRLAHQLDQENKKPDIMVGADGHLYQITKEGPKRFGTPGVGILANPPEEPTFHVPGTGTTGTPKIMNGLEYNPESREWQEAPLNVRKAIHEKAFMDFYNRAATANSPTRNEDVGMWMAMNPEPGTEGERFVDPRTGRETTVGEYARALREKYMLNATAAYQQTNSGANQ